MFYVREVGGGLWAICPGLDHAKSEADRYRNLSGRQYTVDDNIEPDNILYKTEEESST